MAGVVTSGNFSKALMPGVNKWFQDSYNTWKEEWSHLFATEGSGRQYEEDVGESGFGLASVKPEGQGIEYDDTEQNFIARYVHFVMAKGFIVTREMVEDDQYMVIGSKRARALARSMRITKEILGANVFNRGFDPAFTMGADHDGQSLFSDVHPLGPYGGTFSNELAVPADLSEAALEQAFIDINGFVDPRNLPISAQPVELCIPRQLQFEASRILDSEYRPGSDLNDINAIRQNNYLPEGFMVNHYFTDDDAWFVKTNVPDGMKHFARRSLEFADDSAFETENAKFKATERYSFGWSDPRGFFGSPGA